MKFITGIMVLILFLLAGSVSAQTRYISVTVFESRGERTETVSRFTRKPARNASLPNADVVGGLVENSSIIEEGIKEVRSKNSSRTSNFKNICKTSSVIAMPEAEATSSSVIAASEPESPAVSFPRKRESIISGCLQWSQADISYNLKDRDKQFGREVERYSILISGTDEGNGLEGKKIVTGVGDMLVDEKTREMVFRNIEIRQERGETGEIDSSLSYSESVVY